ncbi:hypothetical protein ISS312_02413 [Alteromonas mediterranea]|nr:hypothetical protein ISS312_02413 [Alteromonas mediterranea]
MFKIRKAIEHSIMHHTENQIVFYYLYSVSLSVTNI